MLEQLQEALPSNIVLIEAAFAERLPLLKPALKAVLPVLQPRKDLLL